MNTRHHGIISLAAALCMAAVAAVTTPAQAGSINISLPLPPIPQIRLPAPPVMVWLPIPMVYVALDSPYPIFCHEHRYYLYSHDHWYVGPGYEGPWAITSIDRLPPGLHHYHAPQWTEYQREARHRHHYYGDDRAHPHFYGARRDDHRHTRSGPPAWNHNQREGMQSAYGNRNAIHNERWVPSRTSPSHQNGRVSPYAGRSNQVYARSYAPHAGSYRGHESGRAHMRSNHRGVEHGGWR